MTSHPAPPRPGSVSQDWRRALDKEKEQTYVNLLRIVETAYSMFSVSLDEALEMRKYGRTMKAYQVLSMATALCSRLSSPLCSLLRAMQEHSKHFGTTPHLAPLAAENFQSPRSQRVARMNDLFSRVLFTKRSQFLYKIATISDLVEELNTNFESTAEGLREGESIRPERDWETLDAVHYDLNTCLRETTVLLKSFLHALPEAQLDAFEATHRGLTAAARAHHLAHRRMAVLRGE